MGCRPRCLRGGLGGYRGGAAAQIATQPEPLGGRVDHIKGADLPWCALLPDGHEVELRLRGVGAPGSVMAVSRTAGAAAVA
jgi:hypothetical protein